MRTILTMIFLVGLLVAGGLFAGETMLATRIAALAEADPRVELAQVAPLREGRRVGLRFDGLSVATGPGVAVDLPSLDLWASPVAPMNFHADLPAETVLQTAAGPVPLAMQDAQARLRLAPLNGLAVSEFGLTAGALAIGGQPAAQDLTVQGRLAGLGHDAPLGAGAAYDVDLALVGGQPAAFFLPGTPLPVLPADLTAKGGLRVWLTGAPGQGMWRATPPPPARVIGLRADNLQIGMGDLTARLTGRVWRGADGLAQGQLAILTADGGGFLDMAADAGLIPAAGALLGRGLLAGLAAAPPPGDAADWPKPEPGETMLPVVLREGQIWLGDTPMGPAPVFPG